MIEDNNEVSESSEDSKIPDFKLSPKVATILYVVLIISVIIGLSCIVFWLKGEGKECTDSPLVYGLNKLNDDSVCRCSGDRYTFMVDKEGIKKSNLSFEFLTIT